MAETETTTTAPKAAESKTEAPASVPKAVAEEGIFGGPAYHNNPVKSDVQVESK